MDDALATMMDDEGLNDRRATPPHDDNENLNTATSRRLRPEWRLDQHRWDVSACRNGMHLVQDELAARREDIDLAAHVIGDLRRRPVRQDVLCVAAAAPERPDRGRTRP